MNLALGYLLSRSLHVATELGLADHLAAGPLSVGQLARASGSHAPSLRRLLRCLAAQGVFAEDIDGSFANTPASQLLRQGVMRDGVLLCAEVTGDGSWWNAVGALRQSVQSGEPAFERQHGMGFFDYIARHPECSTWFDRGMANFASAEDPAIAEAGDFGRFASVVDVGGGQGGLLAQVLLRHPALRATLFDQPLVVQQPAALAAHAALADSRWQVQGGDFFQAVPAGADAYVLKRILHDWGDDACLRILRACRAAMGPRSRLLVVDAVVPEGNAPHPAKVMDILMMAFATGRERTQDEFAALLARAGLRLDAVRGSASTLSVVEAVPSA
ncbi:MAG: methyltransferase [Rubrivivax sp.]|nr:methyltransferase [Rubrivivax sp.]